MVESLQATNAKGAEIQAQAGAALTKVDLNKCESLSFVFDGRYKFARYYAPKAFNTPKTLEQIFIFNDLQRLEVRTRRGTKLGAES
jgi:arylsulfatase